jgi:hypothetical protein
LGQADPAQMLHINPTEIRKAASRADDLTWQLLALAHKQNDGFINVDSEPDRGTTFKINLPRYVGKADQLRTKGSEEAASRGRETILLVEDEPAIWK